MEKVINRRYQEIEGKELPIFPCVEIKMVDDICAMRSYFFIHEENKETNKTDIYLGLMHKVYQIFKNEPQEAILEHFTTQYLMEGIRCVRWSKASKHTIDSQGNPVFKLVDSVDESDFLGLSKYI